MFKLFSLFFFLSSLQFAAASTGETQYIQFTGTSPVASVEVRGEQTRTAYRTERQAQDCTETVNTCNAPIPSDNCGTYTRNYTCYEDVRVAYQVFDYYVKAKVKVDFGAIPAQISPNEKIAVSLSGKEISFSSQGTRRLVLSLDELSKKENLVGDTMHLEVTAKVNFHEASKVLKALRLENVYINSGILTYDVGPSEGVPLEHYLKVKKEKFWGRDPVLFEGDVAPQVTGPSSFKLGVEELMQTGFTKGKYQITVSVNLKNGFGILNARELDLFAPTNTFKLSVR